MPLRLGVARLSAIQARLAPTDSCRDLDDRVDLTPKVGDVIRSDSGLAFWLLGEDAKPIADPLSFGRGPDGATVQVTLPDLRLRVKGASQICS